LDEQTIEKGLNSSIEDFEDALQYFSATDSGCDIIITRNGKDFKKSLLPVMTAEEFLSRLGI
ncbi:MAG: PIN domain nuclease, partial [Salibacteraceae bacterium]|nr:PIN domain nuclease [Salibacteraceae bacterium]